MKFISTLFILLLAVAIFSCRKLPLVAFEPSTFTLGVGDTVFFTNSSKNAATYLWEFGDGTESEEESPYPTYDTLGVFTVKLTAISEGGGAKHTRTEDLIVE